MAEQYLVEGFLVAASSLVVEASAVEASQVEASLALVGFVCLTKLLELPPRVGSLRQGAHNVGKMYCAISVAHSLGRLVALGVVAVPL